MSITSDDFKKEIKEEYNNTTFVVEQLDHELNVLLERRQAFMSKDVNPLVVRMDNILSALNPSSFNGDYLYKDDWYKNLDLESWGMYKYVTTVSQEGLDDDNMLVESLGSSNEIKAGAELLIETDTGEKIPRTVESVEWSDYYEKYKVTLVERETTWDRKWMPDALYSKCTDPGDEQACIAYNPCSDSFYKVPIWDDDLPETVESDIIPLKVIYGVGPYTWTIISGEDDGWSLENNTTDDGYNTLYSNYTCDIPVILNVTDFCGNTTDEYTVTNTSSQEISLSAPSLIYQGDSYIVTVSNGSPPYEWDIKEQSSISSCSNNKCVSLQNTSTSGVSNIILTENDVCGSIIIRVKDKCGLTAQCETEIYNTFTYKKIYGVYGDKDHHPPYDWKWTGTHTFTKDSDIYPYLIPMRCVYSGHFSLKWLDQPKLQEISDILYNNYYDPYYDNFNNKFISFPQCGKLEGEENESFEKHDIVTNYEHATLSDLKVGYKEDFTVGVFNYKNIDNYQIMEDELKAGGSSSFGNLPDDHSECGWSYTSQPWEYPFSCFRNFCYDNIYFGYNVKWGNKQNDYEQNRPIKSALNSLRLYGWANKYMTSCIGYFPFYTTCGKYPTNDQYHIWTGYPYSYSHSQANITTTVMEQFILTKKICSSSNYIWEAENFGDEPELIYIQTFT